MSEYDDCGGTNGQELVTMPAAALVDELVLTYNRADGTLSVGGRIVNLEVALEICRRGAMFFETQIRLAAAQAVRQQQADQARVAALLDRTRMGRG